MKKIMLMGSALMMLSTQSFASTARLLALGMNETDNDGMYLIQDERNIFLNPAYVNLYPNHATLEFGSQGLYAGTDTTGATETPATVWQKQKPKAQGGVFYKYGDFVYGVYYGNESNTSSFLRLASTSTASALNNVGSTKNSKMLQTADNQIDLYMGGENFYKWGASLIAARGEDESRGEKNLSVAARFGVIADLWETALSVSLASKAESNELVTPVAGLGETVKQEFKGSIGLQVGGAYKLSPSTKVFGYVKHFGWDQEDSYSKYTALRAAAPTVAGTAGQQGKVEGNFTHYYLGVGNELATSADGKVFTSLVLRKIDINVNFTKKTEVRNFFIPFTVGYEVKANNWLTLRGSVVQNIFGMRNNKNEANVNPVAKSLIAATYGADGKATLANSTAVNAGASLNFGQLTVDGLIGTTSSTGVAATNNGILSLSNLETTVALNYKY